MMKDLYGKRRGRCKECLHCSEYLAPINEYECGFCGHMPKDHVVLREESGMPNLRAQAQPAHQQQEDAVVSVKVPNGKRLLMDVSVHLMEANSLEGVFSNGMRGRLLADPHGPMMKSDLPEMPCYSGVGDDDAKENHRDYISATPHVHTPAAGAPPFLPDAAEHAAPLPPKRSRTSRPTVIERSTSLPPTLQPPALSPVPPAMPAVPAVCQLPSTTSDEFLADVVTDSLPIGKGGQGAVFKGTWLPTCVAVKVFHREGSKVQEECSALRALSHPNVVQFFGITKLDDNKHGIVLELCDNNLSELSRSAAITSSSNIPQPSLELMLKVVKDATAGLIYIHSKGMVHLDIKPKNILVKQGTGKLADFGVAEIENKLKDMTQTSVWAGTPLYRAPELYHKEAPTYKADMWSMGLTLLEAMTGLAPYKVVTGKNGVKMADGVANTISPGMLVYVGENKKFYEPVLHFDPKKRMTSAEWLKLLDGYQP